MLSRIPVFFVSHCSVCQRIRPLFSLTINNSKFKFSTTPSHSLTSKSENTVSKNVNSSVPSSFGEKAKEATKTTYYTAVVLIGVGALGLLTYALFGELLSSFSPQSVYSTAVDKISLNEKIISVFGGNIKCYGETSRRGRRQHINHLLYEIDGRKGMRIKFYLQGQFRSGVIHLDARTCPNGWEFRYILAQTDSYPHDIVIVEDNRSSVDSDTFQGSNSVSSFSPAPELLKDS